MTPEQYATERAQINETTLRNLMRIVMEVMPPYGQQMIDSLGREWDRELDALDSRRAWANAAATQQAEGAKNGAEGEKNAN